MAFNKKVLQFIFPAPKAHNSEPGCRDFFRKKTSCEGDIRVIRLYKAVSPVVLLQGIEVSPEKIDLADEKTHILFKCMGNSGYIDGCLQEFKEYIRRAKELDINLYCCAYNPRGLINSTGKITDLNDFKYDFLILIKKCIDELVGKEASHRVTILGRSLGGAYGSSAAAMLHALGYLVNFCSDRSFESLPSAGINTAAGNIPKLNEYSLFHDAANSKMVKFISSLLLKSVAGNDFAVLENLRRISWFNKLIISSATDSVITEKASVRNAVQAEFDEIKKTIEWFEAELAGVTKKLLCGDKVLSEIIRGCKNEKFIDTFCLIEKLDLYYGSAGENLITTLTGNTAISERLGFIKKQICRGVFSVNKDRLSSERKRDDSGGHNLLLDYLISEGDTALDFLLTFIKNAKNFADMMRKEKSIIKKMLQKFQQKETKEEILKAIKQEEGLLCGFVIKLENMFDALCKLTLCEITKKALDEKMRDLSDEDRYLFLSAINNKNLCELCCSYMGFKKNVLIELSKLKKIGDQIKVEKLITFPPQLEDFTTIFKSKNDDKFLFPILFRKFHCLMEEKALQELNKVEKSLSKSKKRDYSHSIRRAYESNFSSIQKKFENIFNSSEYKTLFARYAEVLQKEYLRWFTNNIYYEYAEELAKKSKSKLLESYSEYEDECENKGDDKYEVIFCNSKLEKIEKILKLAKKIDSFLQERKIYSADSKLEMLARKIDELHAAWRKRSSDDGYVRDIAGLRKIYVEKFLKFFNNSDDKVRDKIVNAYLGSYELYTVKTTTFIEYSMHVPKKNLGIFGDKEELKQFIKKVEEKAQSIERNNKSTLNFFSCSSALNFDETNQNLRAETIQGVNVVFTLTNVNGKVQARIPYWIDRMKESVSEKQNIANTKK